MALLRAYEAELARGRLADDPAQRRALGALQEVLDQLERAPRRRWLRRAEPVRGVYLWGPVGRGKSMLMDLFVRALPVPARRVHFHAFMQEVHAGIEAARREGRRDAIRPVAEAAGRGLRVLALDEMEINDIGDAMIVGRFFEILLGAGVTLVTTSNRPPEGLYENGLNRQLFMPFIDLLRRHARVVALDGGRDWRERHAAGGEGWIVPPGPEARARLDAAWARLTDGAPGAPLTLAVQGREIRLERFAEGVARARFADLCARPLGPADYLAIAAAVRVLILEDIPQLGRANFNEARRFVTLVDALYEAGAGLLASAAAPPDMLYVEGEGSFAFARAASRLKEMQARAFPAAATPRGAGASAGSTGRNRPEGRARRESGTGPHKAPAPGVGAGSRMERTTGT